MKTYLIERGGEQRGPYSLPQLKQMWATGAVTVDSNYWTEGMAQWGPVADLLEDAVIPVTDGRVMDSPDEEEPPPIPAEEEPPPIPKEPLRSLNMLVGTPPAVTPPLPNRVTSKKTAEKAEAKYKFSCPHCGQHIEGPVTYAKTAVTCPNCAASFIAPPLIAKPLFPAISLPDWRTALRPIRNTASGYCTQFMTQAKQARIAVDALPLLQRLKNEAKIQRPGMSLQKLAGITVACGTVFIILIAIKIQSAETERDLERKEYVAAINLADKQKSDEERRRDDAERSREAKRLRDEVYASIPGHEPRQNSYGPGSAPIYNMQKCTACWGRGTITTPSGYTAVCTTCRGTGQVRSSIPVGQSFEK